MKSSLRNEFSLLFVLLFTIILSVWVLFFIVMSRYIYSSTEQQLTITANQIADDLGREFADLERDCYALSTHSELLRFMTEENVGARFTLAGEVDKLLQNGNYTSDLATHIIALDEGGWYYRFAGKLSTASTSRLSVLSDTMRFPTHISTTLENTKYIGYAAAITDDAGEKLGALMMFTEEEKLLDMLYSYSPDSSVFIGIMADGVLISANSKDISTLEKTDASGVVRKHIGITPFEIVVAASQTQLSASTYYFSIAAGLTILSFVLVLLFFAKIQNRRFLMPMVKIMHSAETIDVSGSTHTLPPSGSEEFDRLIEKINAMLQRMDHQNEEIRTSGLQLKNAEIAKQKAVIFSLKKQINAHFTINTLGTIQILLNDGEIGLADTTLSGLSALIRYAYAKDELIGVWDEMRTLEKYIEIMNVRYDNKIELIFNVDDRLMDVLIPRMLLQPLAENAVMHGFLNRMKNCIIEVTALLKEKNICIKIRDNGQGMEPAALAGLLDRIDSKEELIEGIENIALANIKYRLQSQFGDAYSLSIESSQSGTEVMISFPLETK